MKMKRKYYKVNLENPIKSKKDDIFGYDYEVKRIKNAIDQDANVIGIISEYGSGKSSLIELLKKRLCPIKYKFIKVNLWDYKLKGYNKPKEGEKINKPTLPSRESIINLHKTFLRQVSLQSGRFNHDYINRRINANYGVAKISFPSYKSLISWFLIYILLLFCIVFLISKFAFGITTFSDIDITTKQQFISFIISKIPSLLLGFIFFYIIFNKEVLFSFWNNSTTREITEEDTVQIYNELFSKKIKFLKRFRNIIIVIEDLDRIDDQELVEFYLNEFYRLYIEGNESNRQGITMIFCLKDDKKSNNDSRYIKIFDYTSYINCINIDDKEEVLRQLIRKDSLMYSIATNNVKKDFDISQFLWLIEDDDINIRIIKRRMEQFKNIYLMIYSRGIQEKNFFSVLCDTHVLKLGHESCLWAW